MRILAVGAQPGDLEMVCAGTLARYAAEGHYVTLCVAIAGPAEAKTDAAVEEPARVNEQEARDAAHLIGAELTWLGIPVESLVEEGRTQMTFETVFRLLAPDVIVTHARDDYDPLHRLVSNMVFGAVALGARSAGETSGSAHTTVPRIVTMDTLTGKSFFPCEYVDVSSTMETKRRMLACHKNRIAWLKEHNGVDAMEIAGALARARGFQCNVIYAEGFCIDDAWPTTSAGRLLP